MITRKTLSEYRFSDINGYFEYIIDSVTNGQRSQASDLIYAMSKKQIADFSLWLDYNYRGYDVNKECKVMAMNIITCK